ncbi:MAG TPA: hypothetical protein VFT22_03545 [Kofleriaceae bacterium]|nr:hypothetical protein [Kofleriaceae bacterium]
MQFEDPQDLSTAYLILRHIYDGDVIEWPIADDHPLHHVFAAMEAQGYIARWDRTWPRRDRYRLTDQGIAAIEAVYRPAGADAVYSDVRARNLGPADRRAYLARLGYDPVLWPLLHDPTTHWEMFRQDRGRYYDWFWEDQLPSPYRRRRGQVAASSAGGDVSDLDDDTDDEVDDSPAAPGRTAVPYVVDLDREADAGGSGVAPAAMDYDVS